MMRFSRFVECPILPHLVALLVLMVPFVNGWQHFEQPIRLPPPNQQNGHFEWELVVQHKLTMSSEHKHDEVSIHDYLPANMGWLERSKDQLRPCLEHKTLVAMPLKYQPGNWSMLGQEWAERTERALPDLLQMHGRHQRLLAVNGQIPGPTLIVPHNANVVLRLKNRLLLDDISIHLHGIEQRDQWFYDGVPPMQQCPLSVLSDSDLPFRAHPVGTHWYHGQFPNGHQSNGLLGALVVLPEEGIKEDRDFVAILQDWPLIDTREQEEAERDGSAQWAVGRHGEFDDSSTDGNGNGTTEAANRVDGAGHGVWAILVNQKGWHRPIDISYRPNNIPWSKFPVGKDEQVRIRLIHGGYCHPLSVHFEQHRMEVVAADGSELEPKEFDALILYPGERFDVRLHTLRNPRRRTYRMVVGLAEQFLSNDAMAARRPIYGLAELDYGNGQEEEVENGGGGQIAAGNGQKVDFRLATCQNPLRECTLLGCPSANATNGGTLTANNRRKFHCHSVDELQTAAVGADPSEGMEEEEEANLEKHVIAVNPTARTVDGFEFQMPDSAFGPFFLNGSAQSTILAHNCSAVNCGMQQTAPCKCFVHKRFTKGSDIQITFVHSEEPNGTDTIMDIFRRSFSIHLHGHKFRVLKIGYPQIAANGNVQQNEQMASCMAIGAQCDPFGGDGHQQPDGREVQKDTVLVPFGGYTVIRFRANNAGWWLAETQQNGRGSTKFAFAVSDDDDEQMAMPPAGIAADCGRFEPGDAIYEQFPSLGTTNGGGIA